MKAHAKCRRAWNFHAQTPHKPSYTTITKLAFLLYNISQTMLPELVFLRAKMVEPSWQSCFPNQTLNLFASLFHGIDITQIATTPTLANTAIGFVEIIALALIIGWLFAIIYNKVR